MKSLFALLLFAAGFIITLNGQDDDTFFFRDQLRDTANLKIDYSLMKSHYLGEGIARKLYRLEKTYTFTEAPTAMSPTSKINVRKPVIYYAVLKLNNHYRKELKKSHITRDEAEATLGRTLDLAYVMYSQDTTKFEEYLKKNKKPVDIERAFKKVSLY